MNITLTKLYDLLSTKLGKETAENLTNFIEAKINNELESKIKLLATKTDIIESKNEIMKWIFISCVTQVTVTVGFILLYLKYNL